MDKNRSRKNFKIALIVGLIVTVLAIGLAVAVFVYIAAQNGKYQMQGPSMEPTISDGDVFTVTSTPEDSIKRGDIIMFTDPEAPEEVLVKRVIGLPGDIITVADQTLSVTYPDGTVKKEDNQDSSLVDGSRTVVNPRSFYVLGDNRQDSFDSRIFGLVPYESVKGVVTK